MLCGILLEDLKTGLESSGRAVIIRPGSSYSLLNGGISEDMCRTAIHNLVTGFKMSVPKETKPGESISAMCVHCVGHTGQFCHFPAQG